MTLHFCVSVFARPFVRALLLFIHPYVFDDKCCYSALDFWPVGRLVGRLVGRSVGLSLFTVIIYYITAPAQLLATELPRARPCFSKLSLKRV